MIPFGVFRQRRLPAEALVAALDRTLVRSLPSVYPPMTCERRGVRESLRALLAAVWAFTRVYAYVYSQR